MPSKHQHIFFLIVAISIISLQTPANAQENTTKPVYMCYSPTFPANSTYMSNVNLLLSQLQLNTPATGSANTSVGTEPDRVVGAAFCRGDISSDQCSLCLSTATQMLQEYCPNKLLGVGREEKCMLYYYNRTILYGKDDEIQTTTCSDNTITDMQVFQESFQPMMEELIDYAAYKSKNMFATTTANSSSSSKLYGLVQCTPTLSPSQCNNCLSVSLATVTIDCWGNNGASVVSMHCWMRCEGYSFFNESTIIVLKPLQSAASPPEWQSDAGSETSSSRQKTASTPAPSAH